MVYTTIDGDLGHGLLVLPTEYIEKNHTNRRSPGLTVQVSNPRLTLVPWERMLNNVGVISPNKWESI